MRHITARAWVVVSVLLTLVIGLSSTQARQDSDTVGNLLRREAELGIFVSLLEEAALLDTLDQDDTDITVFAPTDEAFNALPDYLLAYLQANPDVLARLLNFHIMTERLSSEELFAASAAGFSTAAGEPLNVQPDLMLVNGAEIVRADLEAGNGVVHTIDSVIIPPFTLPPVDPFVNFDSILTAGSSTVQPVTERMKELFEREGFSGDIVVEETGTNVGIERFCVNAETDVANASRPIREAEIETCRANGREVVGFFIAVDALAITVSRENDFVEDLTLEQLARIFTGGYTRWSEVDNSFPDELIETYSPGADSGTFIYFTEAVIEPGLGVDEDAAEAAIVNSPTIQFSEDDNVLVQGVEGNPYAIGYFGFAYYIANQERLRVVNIEGVEPNASTAESGEYPLSRPLFIYSSLNVMQEKPQVAEFVNFYINNVRDELGTDAGDIGYFPVNENILNLDRLEWLAITDGRTN